MTDNLIPVFTSHISNEKQLMCNARDLHTFLGVGKRYASWFAERVAEYEFIENKDFILVSQNREIKGRGGDRRSKDHLLTMDMAKELAMVERNDKGRQVRRYFIECEKRLRQQPEHAVQKPSRRYCATVTILDIETMLQTQMTVRDDCYKGLACNIAVGLGWRPNSFTALPRHQLVKIN